MGRHCAYGNCNSDDRYKHKDYMKGVRFILFPQPGKDLEKAKRWAHLCGRENFTYKNITKYTYICDLHFKDPQGPTIENPDPVLAIRQVSKQLKSKCIIGTNRYECCNECFRKLNQNLVLVQAGF